MPYEFLIYAEDNEEVAVEEVGLIEPGNHKSVLHCGDEQKTFAVYCSVDDEGVATFLFEGDVEDIEDWSEAESPKLIATQCIGRGEELIYPYVGVDGLARVLSASFVPGDRVTPNLQVPLGLSYPDKIPANILIASND